MQTSDNNPHVNKVKCNLVGQSFHKKSSSLLPHHHWYIHLKISKGFNRNNTVNNLKGADIFVYLKSIKQKQCFKRFLWCSSSENIVFCVLKNRLFKNFGKPLGEHSYWSINQILPRIFFWKSLKSFLKLFSLATASVCPSSSYSFKKICNIYIHTTYLQIFDF